VQLERARHRLQDTIAGQKPYDSISSACPSSLATFIRSMTLPSSALDGKTRIVATVGPFLLIVDVSIDVLKLRLCPITQKYLVHFMRGSIKPSLVVVHGSFYASGRDPNGKVSSDASRRVVTLTGMGLPIG